MSTERNCIENGGGRCIERLFAFIILVASIGLALEAAADGPLRGTVVSVDGYDVVIEIPANRSYLPKIGDMVELGIGDWKVTQVKGDRVRAAAYNATDDNPPKVGMEAIFDAGPSGTQAVSPPKPAEEMGPGSSATGKVVMTRGKVVTIRLKEGQPTPAIGDIAKLRFNVGSDVIPLGTWRVSRINDGNTLEAEPMETLKAPTIGLDALILLQSRERMKAEADKKESLSPVSPLSKKEKNTAPLEPVSKRKKEDTQPPADTTSEIPKEHIEWRETVVTRDFSQLNQSISCSIGTITVSNRQIEMNARKAANPDLHCILPIAEEPLENFSVSFDLQVEGNNFVAGLVFGDLSEPSADMLLFYLATYTSSISTGKWWEFKKNKSAYAWLSAKYIQKEGRAGIPSSGIYWYSDNGDKGDNPSPGTLRFIKEGEQCSFFWNDEKLLSGQEKYIQKGRVGIMYKPISDRRGTAVFNNIVVKKLEQ